MEDYNIVFAIDEGYVQHLCVALVSLLKNNDGCSFKIYIINGGIKSQAFNKIETVTTGFKCKLVNIKIDDGVFERLITGHHFTKANYYRLLMPEFIQEDKILYLDSDIVINGSIDYLYKEDVSGFYICAVENPGFNRHEELRMNPLSGYFNSGIMLINLKKWKEDGLANKVIEFVENNPTAIEFVDQCGLNAIINGRWKKLKLKYNQQSVIYEEDYLEKYNCFPVGDLIEAKSNPVIVHYTGSSKPWHFINKHPYKYLYLKYLRLTPYWYVLPTDFTLRNIIKWMIPDALKKMINKPL
jgi:lipopolysaccharide biosynthesis glycosyltransferase